jgi:DNA repair protein RecN (Recombination protein N)
VERSIGRDGGGRILVDGRVAPAQTVRQRLAPRVDFAAQNEQVRLAEPGYQRDLLDSYGGLTAEAEQYRQAFQAAANLEKRLQAGERERELVRLRLAKLRDDLSDLTASHPNPAVDNRLEDDIRELTHSAQTVQAASEAAAYLAGGDPPCLDALAQARRTVERLAQVSPRLAQAAEHLAAAREAGEAALDLLAGSGEAGGSDPARLDELIGRSEKLKALARRFGCGVGDLATHQDSLRQEVDSLESWDAGDEAIEKRLAEALPQLQAAGERLGGKRRQAARRLELAVNRELAGLGMEQAGFGVELEPLWNPAMPTRAILENGQSGLEEVVFFLSPNPGEAASPLARAASGGESSRAMLAVKAALSQVHRPELMFLDEVDAGVGGRLGRELGMKLRELAKNRQVIVITHLPQIAAYAERHLKVAKTVKGGRTTAAVADLSGAERVEEVAKMIHGSAAGRVTREQAKEMLVEGGNA